MNRKIWAFLVVGGLIMSIGLSFVLNFGSWVHHNVNFIYENGTIAPYHPLSNDYRIGSYNLMIINARNSDSTYPHTELNYTGAFISPSDYKQKPILQINGNDKVIFPLTGDYTA